MTTLLTAVDALVAEAAHVSSLDELKAKARRVLELRRTTTAADITTATAVLAEAIDPEYAEINGWLAMTAGALVEWGADPAPLGRRMLQQLPSVVRKASAFGQRLLEHAVSAEATEETSGGEWVGDRYAPPEQVGSAAAEDIDGADAWVAVSLWATPAVACWTRDTAMRAQAKALLPQVAPLAELNDHARCLVILLNVLDDEPFLVFYPSTNQGCRLRVSGVADNFQLHTLLADTLIKPAGSRLFTWGRRAGLPGSRPHPASASVARGDGPQQIDVPSKGVWNLFNWRALQPDGTLPASVATDHWVWGEGIPADIEKYEEFRVVLLAPQSYSRMWNSARYFNALRPSIDVEEVLSDAATKEWLQRLGNAARA
jgi:hypothetical protein